MNSIFSLPIVKRKLICVSLGLFFGFLCAFLASTGNPTLKADPNFWGSALMWSIVFNRVLIGFVILLAGVITVHPVFKFRFYPWLRGALIGALVSLDISIASLISDAPDKWSIFWITIVAGVIWGLIIDVVATKFAGEGKILLDYENNK